MVIAYYIGGEPHYLLPSGESITAKQYEALKAATAKKDEAAGYRDRKAGYYDKWYRYNRDDNGAAYDKGCVRAVNEGKCPDDFCLIGCAEAAI